MEHLGPVGPVLDEGDRAAVVLDAHVHAGPRRSLRHQLVVGAQQVEDHSAVVAQPRLDAIDPLAEPEDAEVRREGHGERRRQRILAQETRPDGRIGLPPLPPVVDLAAGLGRVLPPHEPRQGDAGLHELAEVPQGVVPVEPGRAECHDEGARPLS